MKKYSILIILLCCLAGWGTYFLVKMCFARTYYNRGVTFTRSGLHEKALESYEKAIKWEPRYAEAWCSKAVVLLRLGRANEALNAIERATELTPDYPFVWNSKAWLLEGLGRTEEAKEAYKRMGACKKSRETNNNKIKLLRVYGRAK
ncbi:MAG: tetratricopeptide repeat protein [bacterium]|nr:tetratricopeptide repeat protein [bacterium]